MADNVSNLDGLERKATKKQLNKAKRIREEGNLATEENNFVKAIEHYSEALLIDGLPIEEKSLLHSNRSYAYLETAMSKLQSKDEVIKNQELAMLDAEEVMKLRPTWWKGYFRAGLVYQFKSEWKHAIDMFDQCLALDPHLVDVASCRDECRYDQSRVEIQLYINSRVSPHLFKVQMQMLRKECGLNFDADEITGKYEQFMDSKNQKERALACLFFGNLYVQGIDVYQDYKQGAELFQKAVEADLPEAMCSIGLLHMEGNGVSRNIPKAVSLFEKASKCEPQTNNNGLDEFLASILNLGISHGQFQIGKCYQNGTGKPLDFRQSYTWYKKASDGGHPGAANNIGILYHFGHGVEKCAIKAKQYWSLAASRGNEQAMDSLAWTCLQDRDFEQAEIWYSRAIEAGNIDSADHKDTFYGSLEEARNGKEELDGLFPGLSNMGKTFNEMKSDIGNEFTPEIAKLIEACSRLNKPPSIAEYALIADSPLAQYWTHLEEISKRASDGHPFARTLLTSMSYFSPAWEYLLDLCAKEIKPADIESAREECILNLANCFRATEIVAYFYPFQLPELKKICDEKMTNEKSELDLAARIVNSVLLSYSPNSEILSVSKNNINKYPMEVFFYKIYSSALAVRGSYVASMKVSEDGLKYHPKNTSLLYCKAGALKMVHPTSVDKIIAAYKEFIQEAPFDERLIPEAYYNMAYHSLANGKVKAKSKNKLNKDLDAEALSYYSQGLEAEQKLLPCFVPCDSNVKCILEALLGFIKK